jgi:IrrE N-terminal-like domain
VMVYLSPELEIESQEQVNFTVAHEFAHVVLRHSPLCDSERGKKNEQMADDLAKEWGFERPEQPYEINKEMLTVYRDYLASRA